ncbi:hypothetical protein FDZ73_19610 [bacterium]|nr:MAG: hypothetical protein FDZ73_19610 [bacterium]
MGEYTPKPWAIEKCKCGHECCTSYHIVDKNGHSLGVDSRFDKEDAQFIVKAVNCHDELLEACKDALAWGFNREYANNDFSSAAKVYRALKTVIAKAEGKD